MSRRLRVLLADDSIFVRHALVRMLEAEDDVEVVGVAENGRQAVALTAELRPDVVVMDVNMPEMNGLDALRHIMADSPTPVLLLSNQTQAGAEVTLHALELGAVDFLDKSSVGGSLDLYDLAPRLVQKIRAVSGAELRQRLAKGSAPAAVPLRQDAPCPYRVVVVGASTGGPRALNLLIPALPADFAVGVVVAQHMPAGFTEALAQRLDRRAPLTVREARNGDRILPGLVLVIPGRQGARIVREGGELRVRFEEGTDAQANLPSVDRLIGSAAEAAGSEAIGVVLTGMGADGAEGLRMLRAAGGRTVAESAESAVIDGMPRAARPYAEEVLAVGEIAAHLTGLCRVGRGR
jgi:two-component system, chemotaxis family, protein-glutamate methylesterase/glutaminase